jgi:flagellar biosynthesis protein FliQ
MSFESICELVAAVALTVSLYGVFSHLGVSLWYIISVLIFVYATYSAIVTHMSSFTDQIFNRIARQRRE